MVCFGGLVIEPLRGRLEGGNFGVRAMGTQVEFRTLRSFLHPPEPIEHAGRSDLLGNRVSGGIQVIVSERRATLQH